MKQWFEQRKETWIPEKTGNDTYREDSGELRMPFFEKDPDWSKFHSCYFEDGRKVYEIPLKNAEVFLPSDVMNSLNVEAHGTSIIQNILFVESPSVNGTFYMPLIARYYPSAEQDIKDFQEIYYNKIPADWSGTLDIWTYDERFFVGFGIEDGQILTTRHPDIASSLENSSKKDPSINHLVSCQRYRITIVIHNIVCAGANNCHVTQGETEYRYVTECTVSSGAGPSLGGVDPIYNYPGSGGGGAIGTIGDSGNTETRVPVLMRPKVTNKLTNPCASQIFIETLRNYDNDFRIPPIVGNLNGTIMKMFEDASKIPYEINNGKINGNGLTTNINGTITVTLNDSYLNSATQLSIARTIIHENVHAYFLYMAKTNTNFAEGLDNFAKENNIFNLPNAHHELMRQYVLGMAVSLWNWDKNYGETRGNLNFDYYYAMAFAGLVDYDTKEPNQAFKDLAGNRLVEFLEIIANEALGNSNAKGKRCKK
ncbi:hypothetical protein [Mongoliitalea lutea]|uniref:SprT-like family protein n=1 Tax=Mongoliitalea lutea TaxID=849756 RepID=A0A8J3G653_9BACT|nr:hypothetical protein [Mongoliitalea lutea]GHB45102.1 hypothetical protein GCM10008106_27570 [Mongoliitalea lutea]